jgi:hypothetical protein
MPVRERRRLRECSARTPRCRTARDPRQETRDCCRRIIAQLTADVGAVLDSLGVPWWLDYGALLGYVVARDKGLPGAMYWNDKDADLNALAEDRAKIEVALAVLKNKRYKVRYHRPVAGQKHTWGDVFKVQLSTVNHTNVDVTIWRLEDGVLDRDNWGHHDQWKGRVTPADWVFPTIRDTWEGVEVNIPAQPERLIAYRYGENWRNLPARRSDGVER